MQPVSRWGTFSNGAWHKKGSFSLMRPCQLMKHHFQLTRVFGNVGWIPVCPVVRTRCLILLYKYFQLFSLKKWLSSPKPTARTSYFIVLVIYLNLESSPINMHHARDAITHTAHVYGFHVSGPHSRPTHSHTNCSTRNIYVHKTFIVLWCA